ncbi:MAG: phosphomannomutase/phosphoglucomutase [Treponema sp.]|nr:phosphomannomutase/phosphoglucomutase [Treponema sp.]
MEENLLKLQNGSDIRGVALEGVEGEKVNLTPAIANRIGQAFAKWLSDKTQKPADQLNVGIGMDSRISGQNLLVATSAGMASLGVGVKCCGLATTPAMFMSIVFDQSRFDGSVMITASHLPFNRNGIKFFTKDGGLEHDDITEILTIAQSLDAVAADFSQEKNFDLIYLYAGHLRAAIMSGVGDSLKPLEGLKIIVDAGNGAGGFFAEKVLKPLGANIEGSQFLEPDGRFPNHIPNPENKEAMESIRAAVLNSHADLGLIFDTDVDRMSAVLDNGDEINRDAIIAMISAILAPKNRGATIITDSVTSDRLTYFLERVLGLNHLRYMRGYKNVINKQKELCEQGVNAPLAMETSGHGALKDNYFLDDGAFLAVQLVIALANAARQGKKLQSLIEKLPPPGDEAELRFKINDQNFREYGQNVLATFAERARDAGCTMPESFEGVRISFRGGPEADGAEGWLLLRLSLHDPVMPLNIEGTTPGSLEKIKRTAALLLTGFDKLDMSALA